MATTTVESRALLSAEKLLAGVDVLIEELRSSLEWVGLIRRGVSFGRWMSWRRLPVRPDLSWRRA